MDGQQQPGTWRNGHITTASELHAMTPQERHEHFQASLVTPEDIDTMPAPFLAAVTRAQARGRAFVEGLIAAEETGLGHREAS